MNIEEAAEKGVFTEEEVDEIVRPVVKICVRFGHAMRHTNLNHKEKATKAWEEFGVEVCKLLKEQEDA
jgi:hypothetical protein